MSIRARLPGEDSRLAALEAARAILIEQGPKALTLKAVGARVGRTHANLLHHFGSAAGLQSALIRWMATSITRTIADAVERAREGKIAPRAIVDLTFDAFAREGAAALVYELVVAGDQESLALILDAIAELADELALGSGGRPVREMTLALILPAIGDALIGGPLTERLGLDREAPRLLALQHLLGLMAQAPLPPH
jgi:AcrR family transcriptional regulator